MRNLPAGTVTFLFTDIEGSTKLWEVQPEAMQIALARHDALLRDAIETHNGYVFKTIGDAFCAAFPTAPDALCAALAAQLALTGEPWPEQTPIKVRMALHTGAVESRDGDYFGQPLNRVARLLATGYGGQTLLSAAAQELVRDSLPAEASLLELGSHRLRDLGRPEAIFQLLHPKLAAQFPTLRSLASLPNNLPLQPTSFVGRESELTQICTLLATARLLTLTGSGGCGKTRLALQVAADLLEGDGAWLVELAPLTDPNLVPATVASVLGLKEEPGKPITQSLVEYLKNKHLLLVLDNCEHLLDACAKLADTLIRQCPRVHILASSREALGIAGELTYRVPSLSLPDSSKHQTPESLSPFESVQLFIERALFQQSTFAVTNANAPALASICHRLDGIPLAIELAAARVRSLSVEEINGKLDQCFRLLTGGSRTALPRQQTLRSLIDWSYDPLSEAEKALLCRLSVFAGGWTLESAEQICSGDLVEDWEVLDVLTWLCDKSLVLAEPSGSSTRYRFLETIRQYARERLAETGTSEAVRERHRDYFLVLAAEGEARFQGGGFGEMMETLNQELDNLRAALEWSLVEPQGAEKVLRLCLCLRSFWSHQGYYSEGRTWLLCALARAETEVVSPIAEAHALAAVAWLILILETPGAAQKLAERGLHLAQVSGDAEAILDCSNVLGNVLHVRGDLVEARSAFREALTHAEGVPPESRLRAVLSGNLGMAEGSLGNYKDAVPHLEEAIRLNRRSGRLHGVAVSSILLGEVLWRKGDYPEAQQLSQEALRLSEEIGLRQEHAMALALLGSTLQELGERERAEEVLRAALQGMREMGDINGIIRADYYLATNYIGMGRRVEARSPLHECLRLAHELLSLDSGEYVEVAADLVALAPEMPGAWELAVRLTAAASRMREDAAQAYAASEQRTNAVRIAAAREALSSSSFEREWESGRALDWNSAMLLALEACSNA
nr:tetratricopeptide repeat protein [Armatimonas sp.]